MFSADVIDTKLSVELGIFCVVVTGLDGNMIEVTVFVWPVITELAIGKGVSVDT